MNERGMIKETLGRRIYGKQCKARMNSVEKGERAANNGGIYSGQHVLKLGRTKKQKGKRKDKKKAAKERALQRKIGVNTGVGKG